ncbi:MAG: hypothetical protein KGJ06_08205, partial [Pseudomonadota bacterium]|nr:hypothetical protein [Pseudomonadota bacterium]
AVLSQVEKRLSDKGMNILPQSVPANTPKDSEEERRHAAYLESKIKPLGSGHCEDCGGEYLIHVAPGFSEKAVLEAISGNGKAQGHAR